MMRTHVTLAALSALVLAASGCAGDMQMADAALCESDRALLTSSFIMTSNRDDAGKYYFDLTLHQVPHATTYVYIPSMNPPLAGIDLPAVFEVGAEPTHLRTVTADQPAIQMGVERRSIARFDAAAGNAIFASPIAGRYPVAGKSSVIQTPERLTTHATVPGDEQSIDLAAARGTVVTAFKGGVVHDVEHRYRDDNSCGSEHAARYTNHLRVLQDDGYEAIYAHLEHESIVVTEGQRVETGQPLAHVGCFDVCTNAHLHLQVGALGNDGYHSVPVHFYVDEPDTARAPRLGETWQQE